MSKATIVSGAPFPICETHPQCFPYEIKLPAADFMKGGLVTLLLEDGYHALYIDWKRGFIDVPDDAVALAERTVKDILLAQFIYDADVHPAIWFVPGHYDAGGIKKDFSDVVQAQFDSQKRWFEVLVRRADTAFNKNRNLAEISDLHRSAAQFLGLEREWYDRSPGSMVPCPACFTLVRAGAAVCYACRAVVDPEKFSKLQFVGEPLKK